MATKENKGQASVVIVTGLSGAGKTSALNVLEDLGYFCIDNLPVAFLPKFIELSGNFSPTIKGIALVMDLREEHFLKSFPGLYRKIKKLSIALELIFLEADNQSLIKRYSETRRKHPVAVKGAVPQAVAQERELLQEIRSLASYRVDTSNFTIHQFKEYIRMDVRFLPNPYFIEEMRNQSGLDQGVREYVLGHPVSRSFTERFLALLKMLIPEYLREGKSYLTVAIGCTGGRHRSVAIVSVLGDSLREEGYEIALTHRDLKNV